MPSFSYQEFERVEGNDILPGVDFSVLDKDRPVEPRVVERPLGHIHNIVGREAAREFFCRPSLEDEVAGLAPWLPVPPSHRI